MGGCILKSYSKIYDCDIAVFGAGPSGMAAAYQAAKDGYNVYLVEVTNKIGGIMGTCPGMMLGGGYPMKKSIGGFFGEVTNRMTSHEPPIGERRLCSLENFGDEFVYDPDLGLNVFYEMLDEVNVNILLNNIPIEVITEKDQITGVVLADTQGINLIRAKEYIDCSGNGDIAVKAGVRSKVGNEAGLMMGVSLTFFMEGVDYDKAFADTADPYYEKYAKKGIEEGKIHKSIPQIYMLKGYRKGSVFFNTVTVTGIDGRDIQSMTKGTFIARKRAIELAKFIKEEIPGFENSHLAYMGHMVGIRETRKLEGMYELTYNDVYCGKKFDDGIVACDNPLDDVYRDDSTNLYSHEAAVKGDYYTIPFRTLIPKKIKNLLFAGKIMSVDEKAFASVRGMPQCMLMGQATGIGAGEAIKHKVCVQEIDTKEVVQRMIKNGVNGIAGNTLL